MSGNLELVLWIYRRSWTYTPFRIGKADLIWNIDKRRSEKRIQFVSWVQWVRWVGTDGHENMIPWRRFVFLAGLTNDGRFGEGFIKI